MLGDRIKKARGKLSQELVAKAVGVTRESVSQWENGTTKDLKIQNLFKLAKFLKKNAEWLGTGDGLEEPEAIGFHAAETAGEYQNLKDLTDDAIKAAREWMKLPAALQKHIFDMMAILNKK